MTILLLFIVGGILIAFGLWGLNHERNESTLTSYTKIDSWGTIIFGVMMIFAAIYLLLK